MRVPDLEVREGQVLRAPVPVRRQRRNLLRRHWLTGALILAGCALVAYTGLLFHRVEAELARLRREQAALQVRAEALQDRNAEIRTEITHFTDPGYVEQMAKQFLGMAYPGETVVRAGKGTGQKP
jgi:cell division protein FtsB